MCYVKGMLWGFLLLIVSPMAWAGTLDSPAPPTEAGSAMYTLGDIYQRLDSNTLATPPAGGFTEPGTGPAPTGHTLNEVYEKAIPTQVPKTGQNTCRGGGGPVDCDDVVGQDGKLQKGVAWPVPRFTDHEDGTVTDNLTGLMWVKAPHELPGNIADPWSSKLWNDALAFCDDLDFAGHTDWRLPNVREIQSLMDYRQGALRLLPDGHPFEGIIGGIYWTSTSRLADADSKFSISFNDGHVGRSWNTQDREVWPVRDSVSGI